MKTSPSSLSAPTVRMQRCLRQRGLGTPRKTEKESAVGAKIWRQLMKFGISLGKSSLSSVVLCL